MLVYCDAEISSGCCIRICEVITEDSIMMFWCWERQGERELSSSMQCLNEWVGVLCNTLQASIISGGFQIAVAYLWLTGTQCLTWASGPAHELNITTCLSTLKTNKHKDGQVYKQLCVWPYLCFKLIAPCVPRWWCGLCFSFSCKRTCFSSVKIFEEICVFSTFSLFMIEWFNKLLWNSVLYGSLPI